MFFEDIVAVVLVSLGLYVIYRGLRKAWEWADIKETEDNLSRLRELEKHVKKAQEQNPIDRAEALRKLNEFIEGEKK